MFKRLLIFNTVYFGGMLLLWILSKTTNMFHFSIIMYVVTFFLGIWEEKWENKIEG